jgi:V-type H+-transporting ATPase subunit C
VKRDDFVTDSEYLETLLVAVPKYAVLLLLYKVFINCTSRQQSKEWEQKYEKLTAMVVPRSSRSVAKHVTLYHPE